MEELAEAIARLADPELREKLSEGARKVARRKDWSHTVSGIGELLAKLGAPVARRGSR
jgi:glycosyltransferase involved in cell wall biosynthesis